MLNITHFRELVIRPTLHSLDMHSEAAENLLLGTAIQESSLFNLKQLGGGPALGLYQMEPATEADIWETYLSRRRDIAEKMPLEHDLVCNLAYATAMARVHYWRVPEGLPGALDAPGMAQYWKRYYNTEQGDGLPEVFERWFIKHVTS